ncbi:MAG TPA: hypothetical protein VFV99_11975 [Kofleriaceae bacterium]|nr:hypothetical protein [Kofleriaceae bacterium]
MRESTRARIILVLGGLVFLAFARPGLMTFDSVEQLAEAREGFYTDCHPPAMAALWRVLDSIMPGGFLLLVLQVTTFLAGMYLVLRHAMSERSAAIVACVLMLFPPVANPMAFMWKDSVMAGLLMLGAGLVLSPCRWARVASLVCFCVGTAVKYNAFAATLPLIVLLFEWKQGLPWLKRYALATTAWLGVTIAAMGTNSLLTDQQMHFWHSSLAIHDIAGVINYDDGFTEDQVKQELAGTGLLIDTNVLQRIREVYALHDWTKLVYSDTQLWDLPINGRVPAPQAQRDAIERAWKSLVFGHPGAYLHHRWVIFLDAIGVTVKTRTAIPPRIMHWKGFLTNLGLPERSRPYQNKWSNAYNWLWTHTPIYTQWLYIVLALALLPFSRGQRDVFAVLASGLVVESTLFFLAPTPDYRYSHWTVVCTCVAVAMLIARRARRQPTNRAGPQL